MSLDARYPALSDLRARAMRRIPRFVWDYLDSATGTEATQRRNRTEMDKVTLMPSILHGEVEPDLSVSLMGQSYPLPFGIAPVGMSGLIWPGAEGMLARAAEQANIPYGLSTVASQKPEDLQGDLGQHAWFQMYPPRDPEIRQDMLTRAKNAGFSTLILTVDVPCPSRRERQTRSGLTQPPRLTPRLLAQVARCPAWAMGMAGRGMPRMRLIDDYAGKTSGLPSNKHAGYLLRTAPDWDYLRWLREAWDGPFVVKGVLSAPDASTLEAEGVDAIWISNHAGRQFDGAPATIETLPAIRAATSLPVILDGGIESGLDILRAFALGADFVMMGRAWHYALGALGKDGPAHLVHILSQDLIANMGQLGLTRLSDTRQRLFAQA
ncbi:alpha-hydroxy-acid oxidizing protein [Roseovarius sp. A21]|uniref:Alpha-hydroxy-acid oxidizing protein n=1 Tax=Roseovarius bejariae TaxID=2576383 RepID=A0A844D226_9RHOB|nr:alpha-hydroxy acid oxidase [Roseovarius bejariae]MRU16850.1 alpha-hydroxy-acid oxidizing protein [Roseovarius bejariae]